MRTCLLFLASIFAMSTQAPTKSIVTVGTAPIAPYSHAVKSGGLIYLSGVLAQDASGEIVSKGDAKGQTKAVIERLRAVLSAAGSSLEQVVSVTVYLKAASDFAAMNEAYSGFWTKDPPTRTTVVSDFVRPDALVEISMIAVPAGAERTVIHPASWIKSPNPYSYAIRTGDTVFLSGLVSRNGRDNAVVPGDINTQTAVVLDNATELLKAAGMTLENVVSSRIYLPDAASFQPMNAIYRKVLRVGAARARDGRGRPCRQPVCGRDHARGLVVAAPYHRRWPPVEPEPQRRYPCGRSRVCVGHARKHAGNQGRCRRPDA